MTLTNRVEAGERPDTTRWPDLTDNGFFFEWRAHCDAPDCKMREVAYSQEHAAWIERSHPCPMKYDPPRRYNYLSIAEMYWIELDGVVDDIMRLNTATKTPTSTAEIDTREELLKLQGRATGLAFAIVHACQPYYPDEKSVSIQANRRWKERNGKKDWEPTPGFKYDPPVPGVNPQVQYSGPDAKAPTYNKTKIDRERASLKAGQVEQIKHAMEGGMFAAADLAKVYKVSAETIEAIGKS